ncbi:MAG: alpha/beta hydrolase [Firmicutes bacterium]|nr:alpha/beta hydrolase [Bacillota bacterium]
MKKHEFTWPLLGFLTGVFAAPQGARALQEASSRRAFERWEKEGMRDRSVIYSNKDGVEQGIYRSVADGLALSFIVLRADNPKGIVQIIHGAQEHKAYYRNFAERLVEAGYTVFLSDCRGHGDSVSEDHPRGHISSIDDAVIDQVAFAVYLKRRFPDLPLALFGHSFGSIVARNVMMEHDDLIDKLVMTGVAARPPYAETGRFWGYMESFYTGATNRGRFLTSMSWKMNETLKGSVDDEAFIRALKRDPKKVARYTNGGAMAMWEGASRLKAYRRYAVKNPDLSILALSGTDDPITGGMRGLADTAKTFSKLGYTGYEQRLFPHMNHDLIHSEGREYVFREIVDFLDR